MSDVVIRYQAASLAAFQQQREGESRLGQTLRYPDPGLPLAEALTAAKQQGCAFVLLGVPEDIGPRANLGQGGSELGWQAFVRKFINLQQNDFLDGSQILILGELNCADLQQQSQNADLAALRALCADIDRRLEPVLLTIFNAGLTPIVIGGGHNNSLPLLAALAKSEQQAVNCINLDPHADFRLLEGRHSGNGFSYAKAAGHLDGYLVMGLHELKNSASSLAQIQSAGVDVLSYQQLFVREQAAWPELLKLWLSQRNPQQAFGIELDTDAITAMPVSAYNSCGVSVQQAEHFVYLLASQAQSRYLHLAEAAPAQHPAGLAAGMNDAGQILTALVCAFLFGKSDCQ
ncbi:MAG: formimidoylglutamase [Gammaproteobacteria bacterium]|nr:formimidoylglutamase [Gammaproteobacteria bacterium]MBU2056530.1 formimidoylglutamase [Gammaproteobacteria bacterium]MBU2174207.1 formimidoylglutamase [Gammaproteobacteria bacterium]MBU2248742.1 formimidoylglutamase [Gammaproteobacteria bacterium]MBU2344620.1 formimidoylglutamase [Gammaproteobacteria bacterium]